MKPSNKEIVGGLREIYRDFSLGERLFEIVILAISLLEDKEENKWCNCGGKCQNCGWRVKAGDDFPTPTFPKIDLELLKRIRNYLPNNSFVTTLLYIPPSQQLRNSADRIEQQEKDERLFDELIESLSGRN